MKRGKKLKFPLWLVACGDAILMNVALLLAFYVRFQGVLPEANVLPFYRLSPLIATAAVVIFGYLDLYKREFHDFNRNLPTLALAITILFLTTNAATFWARGFAFPRSVLFFGAFVQFALIWLWRKFIWFMETCFSEPLEMVVVGGHGDEELFDKLESCEGLSANYRVKKRVYFGDFENVLDEIGDFDAIAVLPSVPEEEKRLLFDISLRKGKTIFIIPRLYDILINTAELKQLDDIPIFEVESLTPPLSYSLIKRLFDVLIALFGLIVSAPIMVLIALVIKLSSPGPALYVQERVGLGGKPFLLYKFRTMIKDAEKDTGPVLATSDDPRITPVGRFLRLTRLDELPQLWNILKGDMSLVGPRPERPVFVQKYVEEIPAYKYRHYVKPGLTGLAQVAGKYATRTHDKLRYDLLYIRNLSLFQDLKIILRTISVIFDREAAEGQSLSYRSGLRVSDRADS